MPVEKSAGAIIFRKENNKIFYLLLHYPGASHRAEKDYWDFPKGHIEKGEKIEDTVKREIFEETGLKDIKILSGFKETIKYFFKFEGENILKFVTFFLAETKEKNVQISFEHIGYEWLPYEEAIEKLTFKNAKEILKRANKFLKKSNLLLL
jgi:8-oxo-dGTP pyrophosphatase MutT (NUDIX family)